MPAADDPGAGREPIKEPTRIGASASPVAFQERTLLAALLFGNFVIGTGILLPPGMLTELAAGLSISVPQAGALMMVSGIVCAVTAPLTAAFTSHVDRRQLLVATLALACLCNIISALASGFTALIVARLGIALAAAVFTPQAASTLGALLSPERRAHGITMIFIGWSLATVAGMPFGGLIADWAGWRSAFAVLALLCAMTTVWVWVAVPGGVSIPRLNSASWRTVVTSPALMLVLLVTVLNGSGHFTQFIYLNPTLKQALGASTTLVTLVIVWFGCAATLGNVAATRLVSRFGASTSAGLTLAIMVAGLGLWGVDESNLWWVLLGTTLWGLGTFSTMSMQHARLAAYAPDLTSATIALNTSAIYIGQALGASIGGGLISAGAIDWLAWTSAAILISAVVMSVVASRWERH